MRKVLVLFLFCLLIASSGTAGTLKMGTGGEKGNYYSMGNDIHAYCKDELSSDTDFQILTSEGSVDNIMGIAKEKKYSTGIIQEDVLQYYAKQDPNSVNVNRLKIITGMHQEVLYLLIPKDFTPKGNGSLLESLKSKIFSNDQGPLDISSLGGQDLGVWGGAAVSAKALKYFTQVNFNIVEVPPAKRESVNMPLLLVGGQPYKPVETYLKTGRYLLISLDADLIRAKAPFYQKVVANYNIGGKPVSVSTVGVRALLLGKSFRKESRNANMSKLSQCIEDSLVDLADDPDTNPNWQSVYDLNQTVGQTNWSYFPLK